MTKIVCIMLSLLFCYSCAGKNSESKLNRNAKAFSSDLFYSKIDDSGVSFALKHKESFGQVTYGILTITRDQNASISLDSEGKTEYEIHKIVVNENGLLCVISMKYTGINLEDNSTNQPVFFQFNFVVKPDDLLKHVKGDRFLPELIEVWLTDDEIIRTY